MRWVLTFVCAFALLFTAPTEVRGFNCSLCPGDLNCDGVVNDDDLDILLACFGSEATGGCRIADINRDGTVDLTDLNTLLFNWGSCL